MKNTLLRPLLSCIALALCLGQPAVLRAQEEKPAPEKSDSQEKEKEEPADKEEESEEEEESGGQELDIEELKENNKKEKEAEKASVEKMLKVFKSLEGEWVGRESLEYEPERLHGLNKAWEDEWKGFYTMDGRYFEMTGQTKGEESSQYRWVCTWDDEKKFYRAWYFGDGGFNRYVGQLSEDGSHVVWSRTFENGMVSEFMMKGGKDRVNCSGTDTTAEGAVLSRTKSTYTRKRVEL